jgi:hypothetical protein
MKRSLILITLLTCTSALAQTKQTRILDSTADVLAAEENEIGIFWARYARGLGRGFEASTHAGGLLISLVNLRLEYQAYRSDKLRVSLDATGEWLAGAQAAGLTLLHFPLALHSTFPLAQSWEMTISPQYDIVQLGTPTVNSNVRTASVQSTLVRYDKSGAFYLEGELPLFVTQSTDALVAPGVSIAGFVTTDSMASWSLLVGRDQAFGYSGHMRLGVGYRRTPGIIFLQSLGHALVQLDIYWRFGSK